MKLTVIKEYEVGDIVFFTDKKERQNMIEQVNPASLFGEIIGVYDVGDSRGYDIQFMSQDGSLYTASIIGDDVIEWFDVLYDMGPATMAVKYGQDIADNFSQRGLFYKECCRGSKHGAMDMKVGDIVFDMDTRAEQWFDAYIANNRHDNVFGVIEYTGVDSIGAPVYVVNYGEDIGFCRYAYQITTIDHFPRKDDPWYSEYTFTRYDNNIMDIYNAGRIEDYKKEYLENMQRRIEESGNTAPITNTPILEPPVKEEPKVQEEPEDHLPTLEELQDEFMDNMYEVTKDIEVDNLNSGNIKVINSNSKDAGIEKIDAVWSGVDPLTKNSQIVKGSTTLIDPE